jgi:hypothetical protein
MLESFRESINRTQGVGHLHSGIFFRNFERDVHCDWRTQQDRHARISFRKPSRVTVSDRPGARKKKIHALSIGFRRVNRALGVVLDRHTCTGNNRTARIGHDPVSKSVADGPSGQAYAPEKIFKAFMRAVSVKNRIDGEISHPNHVIVIGRLQPL